MAMQPWNDAMKQNEESGALHAYISYQATMKKCTLTNVKTLTSPTTSIGLSHENILNTVVVGIKTVLLQSVGGQFLLEKARWNGHGLMMKAKHIPICWRTADSIPSHQSISCLKPSLAFKFKTTIMERASRLACIPPNFTGMSENIAWQFSIHLLAYPRCQSTRRYPSLQRF